MKTKVLSIIAVIILSITISYGKGVESLMQQSIRNEIQFPVSAIEKQLEGAVFVEFSVMPDGSIEVINCNSLVGELQSYVYEKMSNMKVAVDPQMFGKTSLEKMVINGVEIMVVMDPELTGKTYLMRFDFKLA